MRLPSKLLIGFLDHTAKWSLACFKREASVRCKQQKAFLNSRTWDRWNQDIDMVLMCESMQADGPPEEIYILICTDGTHLQSLSEGLTWLKSTASTLINK